MAPAVMKGARRMALRATLAITVLTACPAVLAEGTLEVKGSSVAGRTFTLRDFATLPQTELTETHDVGTSRRQETLQVKWSGVLLRDVLAAADFHEKEQRDFRRTLIVARARDGYVALFTWGELYNTKLGDSILVITSKDGKPLPESEGPYALRALGDIKPGPRHVKWLQQIEVSTIQP
jgi:DMSO/TMAO reductase YedYZ molybdopterin-dependent catalytic subunit